MTRTTAILVAAGGLLAAAGLALPSAPAASAVLLVVAAAVAVLVTGAGRTQPAPGGQREEHAPEGGPPEVPFNQAANRAFAEGAGNPAVVVVEILGIRDIHTVLGDAHSARVIEEVGARMREVAGPWPVAQLSGERFGMAMRAQPFLPAHHVGRQVQDRIGQAMPIGGVGLRVRTAVGVALGDAGSEVLLGRAITAATQARDTGERLVIHSPEDPSVTHRRLRIVSGLSNALDDPAAHGFVPAFQPIVDPRGALVHAEALARWDDPVLGRVTAPEFIPLAEQTGLVEPLFSVVLRAALHACRRWRDAGIDAGVSINVSPLNIRNPLFTSELTDQLERARMSASHVTLELTESSVLDDSTSAIRTLQELRALGFQIALDDFGIGQSSLARLRELPATMVKLDKSFVDGLLVDTRAAGIVKASIDACHVLGMTVVAEGVERDDQADILLELGVDLLQGFLFSQAITDEELIAGPVVSERSLPEAEKADGRWT